MKNAQPRFGLHEESGMLHDYSTGRVVDPAVGTVTDTDGTWDLPLVVTLITEGKSIEQAFTSNDLANKEAELNRTKKKLKWAQSQIPAPPPPPVDKVDQANADFQAEAGNSGSNGQ